MPTPPRDEIAARLDAFQAQAKTRLEEIGSALDEQHAEAAAAIRARGAGAARSLVAVAACVLALVLAVALAALALRPGGFSFF